MKIAHIITRLIIGGAQENTLHTVEDQHRLHGDDVLLITGPSEGPEGSLMVRAAAGGFPIEVVPDLVRSIRPFREWKALRHLKKILHGFQPEIVHTHSSKAGILGRLAAHQLGIPAVHTIHGAAFHYGQSPWAYHTYVRLEKRAARWTEHFISVCDDMSSEYVRAGIAPSDRFTTIYSGFDVEPFLNPSKSRDEVRRDLGLQANDVVVGKIGRLFPLKGHEFLLQAAPMILERVPDTKFLFVGDGILRQEFESQIERMGLQNRFVFTGLVPPTQIPEIIQAMDIVAHTSQWEGLARVLPQGLISGKPVVSYDVGGAREVVRSGETGYLLPRDSIGELAEAIIELARNKPLREQLGARGRQLFVEQFRHTRMTEDIRRVYELVLARPETLNASVID